MCHIVCLLCNIWRLKINTDKIHELKKKNSEKSIAYHLKSKGYTIQRPK